MKNRFLLLIALAASVVSLSSCEKETEGKTRITYYPTIELEGDETILVNKGSAYVEPGYASFMNGEDITADVQVISNVDVNKSGIYTIDYITKENEDGFGSSASRTIIVFDFNHQTEGLYAVNSAVSKSDYNGTVVQFKDDFEVWLFDNGDGTYSITDLFGGWYDQGAGYGSEYACKAVMTISGSSVSVAPGDTYVAGWKDSIQGVHDASYNAATGTLEIQVDYGLNKEDPQNPKILMTFFITLVKQPIE